jgi:hypothetical protein
MWSIHRPNPPGRLCVKGDGGRAQQRGHDIRPTLTIGQATLHGVRQLTLQPATAHILGHEDVVGRSGSTLQLCREFVCWAAPRRQHLSVDAYQGSGPHGCIRKADKPHCGTHLGVWSMGHTLTLNSNTTCTCAFTTSAASSHTVYGSDSAQMVLSYKQTSLSGCLISSITAIYVFGSVVGIHHVRMAHLRGDGD